MVREPGRSRSTLRITDSSDRPNEATFSASAVAIAPRHPENVQRARPMDSPLHSEAHAAGLTLHADVRIPHPGACRQLRAPPPPRSVTGPPGKLTAVGSVMNGPARPGRAVSLSPLPDARRQRSHAAAQPGSMALVPGGLATLVAFLWPESSPRLAAHLPSRSNILVGGERHRGVSWQAEVR